MAGPLAGVRIVDLSQILSGPLGCMILADQEVVKVESPGIGDPMRIGPYRRAGRTSFTVNADRGKRGSVLDLQKPRGRDVPLGRVKRADVFVQNRRPGAAERLGLGSDGMMKHTWIDDSEFPGPLLAPALGEHSEAALAELGYGAGAIAVLRAEGVIP